MSTALTLSWPTRRNWWIDAGLAASGVVVALSSIYFLFVPSGGYQGGRNPYYGLRVLFDRSTWDDLHTWGGLALTAIALLHIVLHHAWIGNMTRRMVKELTGQSGCLNSRGRWNLLLNLATAVSFGVAAASGVYFLFVPGGRGAVDPGFLFSRAVWDLIHTWSGVIWIGTGVVHFAIHWRWVVNVTRSVVTAPFRLAQARREAAAS